MYIYLFIYLGLLTFKNTDTELRSGLHNTSWHFLTFTHNLNNLSSTCKSGLDLETF